MKLFTSHNTRLAALIAVDGLFFGLTNPADVPSFALIIAFLLLVATFYQLVKGLMRIGAWYGINSGHQLRLARIITGVTAIVIALGSMGQLGGRDFFVMVPFVVLTYMYTSYGRSQPERVVVASDE